VTVKPEDAAGSLALPPWLGWDQAWAAAYDEVDGSVICRRLRELCGPAEPGRVVRTDRSGADVLVAGGPLRGTWGADLITDAATDPVLGPTTGDFVWVQHWADGRTTVERVLPRRTAVVRASAGARSHGQVLAANVDAVAVVESLVPEPQTARVERLLALAWDSGATPHLVLTKADLCDDGDEVAADLAVQVAPGVDVHVVSAPTGRGIEELVALCASGQTLALLGGSGAGKSTLLNALVGAEIMETKALATIGKGRHTTVTRELHPSASGGAVIDTPGLRGVGLLDTGGLAAVFPEVEELAAQCRFGDCGHDTEPGCAVQAAVESGDLPEGRLERWRKLQREALWAASRTDARLRKARQQEWKVINKAVRAGRIRP
jgi:ribosome biogenesis GTPase / thiamine phosphate phosphatase